MAPRHETACPMSGTVTGYSRRAMTSQSATSPAHTNWPAVLTLFLGGVLAAMQFAKIPPTLAALTRTFGLSALGSGLMVSAIGLMGVVFSVLAVAPINRHGPRRLFVLGLLFGALCSATEALAQNAATLLSLRFLEGLSQLVLVIAGPALMARSSRPADRGLTLPLWGSIFGVGFAVMSVVAPGLLSVAGWRGLFGAHAAALLAVAGACWCLVAPDPPVGGPDPARPNPLAVYRDVYADPRRLLLAACFCAYTLVFVALLTYTTRMFEQRLDLDAAQATRWGGVLALVALTATLGAGPLLRLVRRPAWALSGAYGGLAACALLVFGGQLGVSLTLACSVLMLACAGSVPGMVFATVPRLAATPADTARASGAISQFGNLGSFLGAPLLGSGIGLLGWPGAGLYVLACAALGIVMAWRLGRAIEVGASQPIG